MKKGIKLYRTQMRNENLEKGESIEQKMFRVTTSNEPIENVSPLLYTDRKDGVLPETDFRTDRTAIAQAAMGAVTKSKIAKREAGLGAPEETKQETETKE